MENNQKTAKSDGRLLRRPDPIKKKRNIGVKVDQSIWKGLRVKAIQEGRLSGDLLDEAIEMYLKISTSLSR